MAPAYLKALCVGLLISVSSYCAIAELNNPCTTPDNYNGVCVALQDCPALYLLLVKVTEYPRSPYYSDINRFLSSTQCGAVNISGPLRPLVCCRRAVDPTIVTHHPNIGMINNSTTCGANIPNRVHGGQEASLTDLRWMALLAYQSHIGNTIRFLCGGSLISERYVLTAAHCLADDDKKLVFVRLGEHNTSSPIDCQGVDEDTFCAEPPQDLGVEETFIHPEYSRTTLVNDVALIRLDGPARIGSYIATSCLPVGLDQTRDLDNQNLTVAGWGATEKGTRSKVLMKVSLPTVPNANCHAIYRTTHNTNIDEKMMCAGGSDLKQDSCNGDSGGPLMMTGVTNETSTRLVQYGIVAYGPRQCATVGVPGVYTRVSYYMHWILDQMRA